MTGERSAEEAREEFAAFVRSTVTPPAPPRQQGDVPSSTAASALFERLFDFRIALGALGLLFLVFSGASHMDAQRYRAIFDEHRYSMGETARFRWRYDGLDIDMRDPRRHLSFWDRQRLREHGLHVTYQDSAAHRMLRSVRMASAFLFVVGLLIAARSAWKRFQAGGDDWRPEAQSASPPEAPRRSVRPVFGRRAD